MRGNVSYLYEAIIAVMALCVLMTPTWKDQVVMKLSHTHLYGFSFGVVSPFRPHRLAGSVESSLGSLAARAYGERRQGRSCQGLATVGQQKGSLVL